MEFALQNKIEEEHAKRLQEKQRHKEEHRKEEELWKQLEDSKKVQSNANTTATADSVTAQLLSPSQPNPTEVKMEDPNQTRTFSNS